MTRVAQQRHSNGRRSYSEQCKRGIIIQRPFLVYISILRALENEVFGLARLYDVRRD